MVINVAVDLALIPHYGITGAAIGWAAAIGVTNLVPLVQVAAVVRVHPFGPGSLTACLLTTLSFAAIPLAVRAIAGDGAAATIAAIAAGCVVLLGGLWLGRRVLHLELLPGMPGGQGRDPALAGQHAGAAVTWRAPSRRSGGTHRKSRARPAGEHTRT
jgi:hypothetical protein